MSSLLRNRIPKILTPRPPKILTPTPFSSLSSSNGSLPGWALDLAAKSHLFLSSHLFARLPNDRIRSLFHSCSSGFRLGPRPNLIFATAHGIFGPCRPGPVPSVDGSLYRIKDGSDFGIEDNSCSWRLKAMRSCLIRRIGIGVSILARLGSASHFWSGLGALTYALTSTYWRLCSLNLH